MGARIMNVLYGALHIPVLLIILFGFIENDEPNNNSLYQGVCLENKKSVVLGGITDAYPQVVYHWEIYSSSQLPTSFKEFRFYCQYQEEIDKRIVSYGLAGDDPNKQKEAIQEYWDFRNSVEDEITLVTNYELEMIVEDIDWLNYYLNFVYVLVGALAYYIGLQLTRMLYQYIIYGRTRIHPYKSPRKD